MAGPTGLGKVIENRAPRAVLFFVTIQAGRARRDVRAASSGGTDRPGRPGEASYLSRYLSLEGSAAGYCKLLVSLMSIRVLFNPALYFWSGA
jgi:hypothetical protein